MMICLSSGLMKGAKYFIYFTTVTIPSLGSMLVYIETASEVKTLAPGRTRCRCWSLRMREYDFLCSWRRHA